MSSEHQQSIQSPTHMGGFVSKPGGFTATATQEGDGSTMIANNGLEKILAQVKQGHLQSSQKGNDVYYNANNAVGGNDEAQMQKHNERTAVLKADSLFRLGQLGKGSGGKK